LIGGGKGESGPARNRSPSVHAHTRNADTAAHAAAAHVIHTIVHTTVRTTVRTTVHTTVHTTAPAGHAPAHAAALAAARAIKAGGSHARVAAKHGGGYSAHARLGLVRPDR
jgi:hypothetical protein